jgi:sulfur carrier protein ThiS
VTVRTYGCWHPIIPGGRDLKEIQIPDGASVKDLLGFAEVDHSDIIMIAVNGEQVDEGHILHDHDRVSLFCPVEGG